MRTLSLALLALLTISEPATRRTYLNVGDPAPALRPARWLKGTPTASFAPGRVYVVEFWAT